MKGTLSLAAIAALAGTGCQQSDLIEKARAAAMQVPYKSLEAAERRPVERPEPTAGRYKLVLAGGPGALQVYDDKATCDAALRALTRAAALRDRAFETAMGMSAAAGPVGQSGGSCVLA